MAKNLIAAEAIPCFWYFWCTRSWLPSQEAELPASWRHPPHHHHIKGSWVFKPCPLLKAVPFSTYKIHCFAQCPFKKYTHADTTRSHTSVKELQNFTFHTNINPAIPPFLEEKKTKTPSITKTRFYRNHQTLQSHSGSGYHPACSFILQNQGPHFWEFNAAGDSFWLQTDCSHSALGKLYHFQKKTTTKKNPTTKIKASICFPQTVAFLFAVLPAGSSILLEFWFVSLVNDF